MAFGWSGSNGGIQGVYGEFILADVEAGISKYISLYKNIPKQQTATRELYQGAINGLKELRQKITEGLEGVTEGLEEGL